LFIDTEAQVYSGAGCYVQHGHFGVVCIEDCQLVDHGLATLGQAAGIGVKYPAVHNVSENILAK